MSIKHFLKAGISVKSIGMVISKHIPKSKDICSRGVQMVQVFFSSRRFMFNFIFISNAINDFWSKAAKYIIM